MSIPVSYLTTPSAVVNQSLDRIGADEDRILGDVTDGSRVGEAARRSYGRILRQLLRSNHWPFARRQQKLQLLGDVTGGAQPPVIDKVEPPWSFAYAWPTDAVQGRWMPWNPASAQPTDIQGTPLTTANSAPVQYNMIPGRFLVTSSSDYPIEVGQLSWDQLPDLQRTEGLGPIYRKIILTNCACAHFVYTRLVTVIEEWDDDFREAMVVAMALALAPVAIKDRKEALQQRNELIPILNNTLADAKAKAMNEAGFPQSTSFQSSWITGRNAGYLAGLGYGNFGAGVGGLGYYGIGAGDYWGGSVY